MDPYKHFTSIPAFLDDNNFILTLKTSGKSKQIEDFNILEEYMDRFNEKPSVLRIDNDESMFFDMNKIRMLLEKNFPNSELLFKDDYYSLKYKTNIAKREIWLIDKGYILVLSIDSANAFFNDPKIDIGVDDYFELCDYNSVIIPNTGSKNTNNTIIDKLIYIFEKSTVIENKRPTIGMVAVDNGDLYVKDFNIGDNFTVKNMDLHYGEGFKEFNNKLIKKLKTGTKGLVLLHGEPGTGKTFYIRHLLNKISKEDKSILYFPPSMVGTITDPSFVNFINSWINDNSKSCIILIEDAEPLLVSRENDGTNIGITNLLNLTDGLLNDIFGIQIIATFNTDLENLDKALLRPERLIARKEFKPLTKENAYKLAEKINVDKNKIKDKMTLADIYAIKKNNQILLHGVDTKSKKIGFNYEKTK